MQSCLRGGDQFERIHNPDRLGLFVPYALGVAAERVQGGDHDTVGEFLIDGNVPTPGIRLRPPTSTRPAAHYQKHPNGYLSLHRLATQNPICVTKFDRNCYSCGMDQKTYDFLLREYEAAWAHIRDIDNRRLKFVEFYIGLNALLSAGITAFIAKGGEPIFNYSHAALTCVGATVAVGGGVVILGMIGSEREANVRFRKRANYIRGIFLLNIQDSRIVNYLDHWSDLNTPTNLTENVGGRGKTLTYVYKFIRYAMIFWILVAVSFILITTLRLTV